MALALSRNSRGLTASLPQRLSNSNKIPLARTQPVQVIQVAYLRHMGSEKYPYVKPFPYWEKKYTMLRNLYENSNHRMCEQSKVIVIEGNAGVGKHKFAERLAKEFDLKYFRGIESDDLWVQPWNGFNRRDLNEAFDDEECHLMNYNDLFNDPNLGRDRIKLGQAARMQYESMVKRVLQYTHTLLHLLSTGQGIVTVRNPYAEQVFVRAMRDMGWLTGAYAKFQIERFNMLSSYILEPHLNIYLHAPVDVCLANIEQKKKLNPNYPAGPNLNADYLKRVEHHYRDYLNYQRADHEVMELDWAEAADESELDVIWEFISKLTLAPEDVEGTRYHCWHGMTDDTTGNRRVLYADRDLLQYSFSNAVAYDADEFTVHWTAEDKLREIYDQHPMTRYSQNYWTMGWAKTLLGGTLAVPRGDIPAPRTYAS